MTVRLVASDLDGTLLRSDHRVSQQTMAAIDEATAAGITVVAATGRQATGLPQILRGAAISWAVASNGAIGVDLTTGEAIFIDELTPEVLAEVMPALRSVLPEVRYCVVRDNGATHLAEPGYEELLHPLERALFRLDFQLSDEPGLAAEPTLKLVCRHPSASPEELHRQLEATGLTGFHATTSGAPFLEVQGAGVTKASGIAQLCRHLGISAAEVAAIGDAPNDIEMLGWAGTGVAMGNAVPQTRVAADWSTATNDEDGVALAIRRILAADGH